MLSRDLLKKAIFFIVISVLSVMILTACGSSEKSSTEAEKPAEGAASGEKPAAAGGDAITLRFAWWGNQVRNDLTQKANERYHELNGNVTVQGSFYQWSDYWSKMATQSAGKQMPDIIQMDLSYIDQYVSNNQLLDLTPYILKAARSILLKFPRIFS